MKEFRLPTPNEADVQAFKELYKRRWSIVLSDEEAYRVAKQVIGIVYVQRQFPIEPSQINDIEPIRKQGHVDGIARKG